MRVSRYAVQDVVLVCFLRLPHGTLEASRDKQDALGCLRGILRGLGDIYKATYIHLYRRTYTMGWNLWQNRCVLCKHSGRLMTTFRPRGQKVWQKTTAGTFCFSLVFNHNHLDCPIADWVLAPEATEISPAVGPVVTELSPGVRILIIDCCTASISSSRSGSTRLSATKVTRSSPQRITVFDHPPD